MNAANSRRSRIHKGPGKKYDRQRKRTAENKLRRISRQRALIADSRRRKGGK